ncbi:MAG: RNA 2',3'-cyclic phosphodiesterase [Solirubrobacteraceae bacterium]
MTEHARLFVAASLPGTVRADLARWARGAVAGASGVRRLSPESMHVTLCFLGEQPLACVEELAGVLGGAAAEVAVIGEIVIGPPVWLPPRRPRALAVELGDPGGGLAQLRAALARDIAATIDWTAGRERFRPHVTVARMRPSARQHDSAGVLPPTPQISFIADTVVLLRTHLEPGGARYEALASVGGWGEGAALD